MTPPMVSTIPACLDAFLAAARRALPGKQVLDGQPFEDIDDDLICIGFTGTPGEASVTETRSRQQGATAPDRESYDITSVGYAWAGAQTDPKKVRDKAFGFVNAIAAELASDQTLGGVVMTISLRTASYAPAQTRDGAEAYVQFVAHVEAFTGRF